MNRLTLPLADKETWLSYRTQDITSTDCAKLFGCSPYGTKYELWHEKKTGQRVTIEETERMKWGNRLEGPIAMGVATDEGWKVQPFKEYMRLQEYRLGSSFDWAIDDDGILEIKCVDGLVFKDQWEDLGDGQYEAPPHIELQIQHQMLVSGRKFCVIAALVGGNKIVLIRREADEKVHSAIIKMATDFWASIDAGEAPDPDFEKDADTIASLYVHAEPGTVLTDPDEAIGELVQRYSAATQGIRSLEIEKKAIKAEILTLIGDVEKVKGPGYSISCGMVGPVQVEAHERGGYRGFRVYKKKEKKS